MKSFLLISSLALALSAATPALAHITLETGEATIGSYYKAVVRVPHGCNGSATTQVRVRIPEGVVAVKPQPKAQWTLDTTEGDYAATYTLHGAKITTGVTEISWAGTLPDAYYDEFVFRAYLTTALKAGETLYFPIVQACAQGVERWIDISGKPDVSNPAPGLKLLAPKAQHAHSH
ncbi:YcnI family protein [Alcaligenaceae bacterium CGII-47]|nr:YcnI family protein [Alcaligenaceae bacterium CGII-47]